MCVYVDVYMHGTNTLYVNNYNRYVYTHTIIYTIIHHIQTYYTNILHTPIIMSYNCNRFDATDMQLYVTCITITDTFMQN
jgi:hypothetical protein